MSAKKCPKCGSENMSYTPWLGQFWQCKDCGYRGQLFLDITERALWDMLKKIPKGKVTTYKILADQLGIHQRTVASMLSKNKYPEKYPCYRVINSDGSLGGYSGKGGIAGKRKLLKKDGIEIKQGRIDLSKNIYKF